MLTIDELESLLFVAGEDGVSIATIADVAGISEQVVQKLSTELQSICESSSRPYILVTTKGSLSLITKSKYSDVIARVRVQIDKQPLTKSHVEVLSVLLYNGPTTKTNIDAYRGVNSGQALRSLALRGMVEKVGTSHGSTVFQASQDVLHMLGVTSNEDLPQYKRLQELLRTVDSKTE